MKPKHILVPTDFSPASRPALVRGLDLATQYQAEAHVLHVVPTNESSLVVPIFDIPPEPVPGEAREKAREILHDWVSEVAGEVEGRRLVVEESPYVPAGILKYASDEHIDLIVMGTHGRRGARRFFLGSVAEEIVRKSPCPVLTVAADQSLEPQRPERILGAVDLEEGTADVISAVRELAALYHADMSFVHVVPPINYLAYTRLGEPLAIDRGETLVQAESLMAEHMESLGVTDESALLKVLQGIPDAEIVQLAKEQNVDMLVVATHARVGLPHVLLGSVADRVLRTAPCPVLTILGGQRKQLTPVRAGVQSGAASS